ncbi:cytochrome P450 monooxygenase monooxygenase [Fusarium mundagurra]|uniref:Cytochrome P450 monooxygenase monooxygenase n=1 Tax=Fusarium mundagurra TaxID=1567541 RepID=A0A8H5Y9J2_9HYPO|nr:cytochrome P450 monooxygenase monooxygenase [Fusarium mundagurra]
MVRATALVLLFISVVAAAIGDGGHQRVEKRADDASDLATRAEFITFSKHLAQVRAAKYEHYSSTPVRNKDAFVKIQQHILRMYGGVTKPDKVLSYMETDDYVDCLPFMQQPTIHLLNLTDEDVKPTANVSFPDFPKSDGPQPVEMLWQVNMSDPYGNNMKCKEGTVPLMRLTLEYMTKFGDLEGLFRKPALPEPSVKKGTATGRKRGESADCTHIREIGRDFAGFGDRYIGASTAINIWKPAATFSLSQLWLVFEASSPSADQSVESGWAVVHPDANPRTFIYFMSRSEPRVGCWNTMCEGFVVTGSALHVGRAFSRVSSFSTTDQWEVGHVWILGGGRWVLFRRTGGVFSEIGFYPTSLFGSTGMASGANRVDFGGEVCDWLTPGTYGQMGSGRKSEAGFGFAAYQRDTGARTFSLVGLEEDSATGRHHAPLNAHPNALLFHCVQESGNVDTRGRGRICRNAVLRFQDCRMLYAREMENTLAKLAPLLEGIFRKVMQGGHLSRFNWSRFFLTKANKSLKSFKEQWNKFNKDALARAFYAGSRPPIVDLYKAVASGTISQDHLLHTLDEIPFANLDVTLGAIPWNLVFLAANPEHQCYILDEVREWKQSPKGEDFNNYFTDSTTYLSACISKSSRLRPLAAFSVPQAILTDRVINGYLFPAGTNFIVDA